VFGAHVPPPPDVGVAVGTGEVGLGVAEGGGVPVPVGVAVGVGVGEPPPKSEWASRFGEPAPGLPTFPRVALLMIAAEAVCALLDGNCWR
jgi:hypothetical protein